jgi:hypothetical protein
MAAHYRTPCRSTPGAVAERPQNHRRCRRLEEAVSVAILRRFLLLAAALALPGCASVATADGERLRLTSDEFRGYVERVFREQNRLADELAFALEGPADERTASLAAAETELLEACAGINEIATARRDGRRLSALARLRAARSAPKCEGALRRARSTLDNEGDGGSRARGSVGQQPADGDEVLEIVR